MRGSDICQRTSEWCWAVLCVCCVIIKWVWTTSSVRVVTEEWKRLKNEVLWQQNCKKHHRGCKDAQREKNITGSSACWYVTRPPRLLSALSCAPKGSVKESSKTVQGSLQLWSNTSLFHPGNMNEKMKKLIVYQMFLTKPWMHLQWSVSEADKLDDSTFYVCTANQKKSLLTKKSKRTKNKHDFANRTQKLDHRLRSKTSTAAAGA